MSSENISNLKVHFVTDEQFNNIQNPSASELWFTKLPHWLNYSSQACLGIVTQPTASGDEINFYAGAVFIVHLGKNADGTHKNQILYIDEDKYLTVSADGAYCFDENGDMVSGTITYNPVTNKVSVNGTEGNYTQAIQTYTYSGGIVTLNGTITPLSIGITYNKYSNGSWVIDYGNGLIEQGGTVNISSSTTYIAYVHKMKDTNYDIKISAQGTNYSYGNGGCIYNSTVPTVNGFTYYGYTSYTKKLYWSVKGLKA